MFNSAVGLAGQVNRGRGRETWYPLAPLQAGMLYDALRLGRSAGYDIEQVHLVLPGPVDTTLLTRAFQWLTRRHSSLHSEFQWDETGRPMQRPVPNAALPVECENWSRIPESERTALLASFLDADRRRGFDMRQAPLGRGATGYTRSPRSRALQERLGTTGSSPLTRGTHGYVGRNRGSCGLVDCACSLLWLYARRCVRRHPCLPACFDCERASMSFMRRFCPPRLKSGACSSGHSQ